MTSNAFNPRHLPTDPSPDSGAGPSSPLPIPVPVPINDLSTLLPKHCGGTVAPVSSGVETVLSFFDLDAFGITLQENGFTAREYLTKLITLCDSPDEKTRLAALRELRAVRREVLEHNGLIAKTKQTFVSRNEDGTEVRASASSSRLLQSLTKEIPRVQEGATIHLARTNDPDPGLAGRPDLGINTNPSTPDPAQSQVPDLGPYSDLVEDLAPEPDDSDDPDT